MPADSGENVFEKRVEYYVEDRAAFEQKLRASSLELPEHVVVLEGGLAVPAIALPAVEE